MDYCGLLQMKQEGINPPGNFQVDADLPADTQLNIHVEFHVNRTDSFPNYECGKNHHFFFIYIYYIEIGERKKMYINNYRKMNRRVVDCTTTTAEDARRPDAPRPYNDVVRDWGGGDRRVIIAGHAE